LNLTTNSTANVKKYELLTSIVCQNSESIHACAALSVRLVTSAATAAFPTTMIAYGNIWP